MSSIPVSRLRLLIYFVCASVVRAPLSVINGALPYRPPVVSKLLRSFDLFACPLTSRSRNGSWSHYTVFKVLRSLPGSFSLIGELDYYTSPVPICQAFFRFYFLSFSRMIFLCRNWLFSPFRPLPPPVSAAIFFIFCWIFAVLNNLPGL